MKSNNLSKVPDGKIRFKDPDSGLSVKVPEPPKIRKGGDKIVDANTAIGRLRLNDRFRVR